MISEIDVETKHRELEDLIKQQGKPMITNIADLQGNFWPEEESTEDFLKTLREWRNEGYEGQKHGRRRSR